MALKKILCILLSFVMIAVVFAGCAKQDAQSSAPESSKTEESSQESKTEDESSAPDNGLDPNINVDSMYPVVNDPVEMSILVRLTTDSAEPEDIWFWQYYERKTNVKWDFTTVLDSAWAERKPVMMATGDYPGVIMISDAFTTNEIYNYGKDGTFLALNDYIADYSTELNARFDEFPDARAAMTCPDGNIYALCKINPTSLGTTFANINMKWLEQTGLAMPTTLDELYEVLKAFKELGDINGDGIDNEVPWCSRWSDNGNDRAVILNALGILTSGDISLGAAIKDGSAEYFPMDEDYLKYLTYANKLYSEGLIDQDAFTITSEEMVAKGQLGTIGFMGSQARYYTAEGGWEDYNFYVPLVENEGDTPVIFKGSYVNSPTYFVTDNCDNPAAAVRWIDIFYDALNSCLAGYGPNREDPDQMLGWEDSFIGWVPFEQKNEGIVWTKDDPGTETFVTLDFRDENGQFRPEDMSSVQMRNMYMLPWASAGIFMMGDEWFYGELDLAYYAYSDDLSGSTESIWRKTFYENAAEYATLGFPSMYFFSDEETQWINENLTILTDYAKAEEAKFITGKRPLSEFNDYVEQLKALGAEKYNEILYNYYESYKASLA